MLIIVILFWKMIELNKVRRELSLSQALLSHLLNSITFQKFRAYLLDSDKTTDVLAYLLCYGLDIKDKPRTSLRKLSCHWARVHSLFPRATWSLSCIDLYHPDLVSGTCVRQQAFDPY